MAEITPGNLLRTEILEWLQGRENSEPMILIGFAMVVEGMTPSGERLCFKVTSDASGTPLAWHTEHGLWGFGQAAEEFDYEEYDDE